MNIDIRYRQHIDLVYHMLAHMRVGNASDCFDQAYIDKIRAKKKCTGIDLQAELKSLEPYYNENFDRVMLLSFLPFYCESLDELKVLYLTHERFTVEDREQLIKPLITILERESAFYYNYWQNMYDQLAFQRHTVETFLKNELSKYARLFDYFKKDALVCLSFSIRKNGRGFYQNAAFGAMTPFPETESAYDNAFFTVLHECTHQFTDSLLGDIRMADGSHDQSENIVMLFITLLKPLTPPPFKITLNGSRTPIQQKRRSWQNSG